MTPEQIAILKDFAAAILNFKGIINTNCGENMTAECADHCADYLLCKAQVDFHNTMDSIIARIEALEA